MKLFLSFLIICSPHLYAATTSGAGTCGVVFGSSTVANFGHIFAVSSPKENLPIQLVGRDPFVDSLYKNLATQAFQTHFARTGSRPPNSIEGAANLLAVDRSATTRAMGPGEFIRFKISADGSGVFMLVKDQKVTLLSPFRSSAQREKNGVKSYFFEPSEFLNGLSIITSESIKLKGPFRFRSDYDLKYHFEKHAHELEDFDQDISTSKEKYVALANDVLENPPPNSFTVVASVPGIAENPDVVSRVVILPETDMHLVVVASLATKTLITAFPTESKYVLSKITESCLLAGSRKSGFEE